MRALAGDYHEKKIVILDLALATPALATTLGTDGPRVLAFGDPENADIALGANLVDFIAETPTSAELTAALNLASEQSPLHHVGDLSDRAVARLGMLGAEATRVADALARLAAAAMVVPVAPLDAARLRAVIEARRARDQFFPAAIFGEPAWDMLLDLACAVVDGHDVAVSSLCIAAAVPTTTALRWIKTMIDLQLFERRADPNDARRAFVSLSAPALAVMTRYLAQTPPTWPAR